MIDKNIYNEDGTVYNPPMLREYKDFLVRTRCNCGESYSCMYCNKCPSGANFKWPEEMKYIKEQQEKIFEIYIRHHNPKNGFLGIKIPVLV